MLPVVPMVVCPLAYKTKKMSRQISRRRRVRQTQDVAESRTRLVRCYFWIPSWILL